MPDYTPTNLAWAAGYIDGDGSINVSDLHRTTRQGTMTIQVRVNATSKVLAPIEHLHDLFQCGTVTRNHHTKWGSYWHWQVTGMGTLKVLQLIEPFLIIKREQAKIAIEFLERVDSLALTRSSTDSDAFWTNHFRQEVFDKIRVLNGKEL